MKVRNGFVSNSSSSSFIVVNPGNLDNLDRYIQVAKLNKKQIKGLKKHFDGIKKECNYFDENELNLIDNLKDTDEVYATNFLSDCCDYDWGEYRNFVVTYMYGGHGVPYNEEELTCLNEDEEDVYRRVYINE